MKLNTVIIVIFGLIVNMCSSGNKFITPDSDSINYSGRIEKSNKAQYELYWPGTSISIKVNQGTVTAFLSDDIGQSYYNVIIDGKNNTFIKPDTEKQPYVLASYLPKGEHTIELFRRTEYPTGTTHFFGFEVSPDTKLLPIEKHDIQLVCIGNSITTGYANENSYGNDRADSIFTNNYLAYGAIASRHFKADYQCIARGGIGFMVSWYDVIMPEIFNLTNPNNPNTVWIPAVYDKRVVVVNLGQNDSWILSNSQLEDYKFRFGDKKVEPEDIKKAYKQFITDVRSYYPDAYIICALGSMDAVREGSQWFGYIQSAVVDLKDPKISTLKFPFLAEKTHPTVKDHHQMADLLVKHIENSVLN